MVNANGITKHDSCISYYLPYAFDNCFKKHSSQYLKCNKFFEFFDFIYLNIMNNQIAILEEIKEKLQYYLVHII